MSATSHQKRDDLLTALALTELSVHYEQANPELANRAWQLAADRLIEYDIQPSEIAAELEIGESLPPGEWHR
ncbi:hypothetical protein [Natrarchaeobius chitinivorans]|uniref:Uncharacterized protein n=1 Tax=Natrarchaeobius chitinivorans TaxID=1679083 RepID=A0A3N6P5I6_NATCH|nr:hypothetical protein [Natrarchaeobius chitinivorans]RQG90855.1 hypothetical protein EA473_19835 [Natrarchaeobius chitinivorans]